MRRRRRIPPQTFCRDCGKPRRAWVAGALCASCLRSEDKGESMREQRQALAAKEQS